MSDFLQIKREEISARLAELKPLVEEYESLLAAESALAGVGSTTSTPAASTASPASPASPAAAAPRRPGRPAGRSASAAKPAGRPKRSASAGKSGGTGRRGRPKGSGKRAQQALELVRAQPGISVSELATAMGIKQNYLYRVLPGLAEQGLVKKSGKGWYVRES